MANFIGLTGSGGAKVMVNADHIVTLATAECGGKTFVALTNLAPLFVLETIYQIVEMLEPEWEV